MKVTLKLLQAPQYHCYSHPPPLVPVTYEQRAGCILWAAGFSLEKIPELFSPQVHVGEDWLHQLDLLLYHEKPKGGNVYFSF